MADMTISELTPLDSTANLAQLYIPLFKADGSPDNPRILASDLILAAESFAPNVDAPGPFSVTSKEVSGGIAYVDVGATVASQISASWKVGWRINVALSPADANYDGFTRFLGVVGNRVSFVRIGGSSSQALTACTGTVRLDLSNPVIPYTPTHGGQGYFLTTTAIPWDQGTDGDNQGMNLADLYLRPSSEPRTALHIQRPNGAGADTGFPVIFGKRSSTAWQWLSDGHTVRRFSNNGQSHNDNSYGCNVQPFYTWRMPSRGGQANGGAYLAANAQISSITPVLCLGSPADGVWMISGTASGDTQSTTSPAALAVPPREPSALSSGSTNNYSPGVGLLQFWSANAGGSTVTGMVAGQNGETRFVHVSGGTLTVSHESGSSDSINRFTSSTGADLSLVAGSVCLAVYRTSSSRWQVSKIS